MTDQQHQRLKALAALQSKTIKQYALERLLPDDADSARAWEELRTLLESRIDKAVAGALSPNSVADILDEELAENTRA